MAIIIDPDNLDRHQVIFGTENKLISLYDVGSLVDAGLNDVTDGYTNGIIFESSSSTFITDGVQPGDIICLFTGLDAGHYIVDSVDSETEITVVTDFEFSSFVGDSDGVFDIRNSSGGSIADGVTEQAVYSFSKEEWKTDGRVGVLDDDLIRHTFPFEPITREQMEIGGGNSHEDWAWFNEYTRKKIRTGGWSEKNISNVDLEQWAGIITLGDLDTDTSVYYQQVDSVNDPVNFMFLGPVNESIKINEFGGDDNRAYLKLFARKKYRTYSQSTIADIGVSQLETIVNRFPLSHTFDATITKTDGEILGTDPFRDQSIALETGINGVKTALGSIFTSSGSTFVSNNVKANDTLRLINGSEQGYYTILSVDSETQLTIKSDFDFFDGWVSSESSLIFTVTSTNVIDPRTNGVIANVSGSTGTLTSSTGGFSGVVSPNFKLVITEAASAHRGVYKIISVDSDTQLTIDTSDQIFTSQSNIDFYINRSGMYLQFKESTVINNPTTGDLTFANDNPDTITRATGNWISDGVTIGDVIGITGSISNNGFYTVANVATTILTLVTTDVLLPEVVTGGVGTGLTIYRCFKRTIGGVVYSFKWRIFGNDAQLSEVYQFVQHQLRQPTDIDFGPSTSRGDITDLLMSFSTPTGTTFNSYIDDLSAVDINNVTWTDYTGASRLEPFVSAGTISFNENLQNDMDAEYTMFFTDDSAGDNLGKNYGTPEAIIVQDANLVDISGNVSSLPSISFTYDYDGNTQRGAGSAGTDVPVTIVAIGLNTAQFVLVTGTITRSKSNNFSLVSALERNYSND